MAEKFCPLSIPLALTVVAPGPTGGAAPLLPIVVVAVGFGVDPVHFGIIMVINLALGMITPPFGVNLFAASSISGVPLERMVRPLLPFVATVVACLLIITYVPQISLVLRGLVYR